MLATSLALAVAFIASPRPAIAKTPGETYCLLGHCHRVLTLLETLRRIGRTERIEASHYDDCRRDRFNACGLTSSGEVFRPDAPDNAASPIYPDGTTLLLFNPATEAAAVVRVNNAGPYRAGRLIDVSRATAEALGFRHAGTAQIEVRVLAAPARHEALYRKRRRYDPVHGPIGRHASIAAAHAALRAATADYRLPVAADHGPVTVLPAVAATLLAPAPVPLVAAAPPPAEVLASVAETRHEVQTLAATDRAARAVDRPEPIVERLVSAARDRARRDGRRIILTDAALADAEALLASLWHKASSFARRARIAARAGLEPWHARPPARRAAPAARVAAAGRRTEDAVVSRR